ncbi:alpha/beta hydrolase family protein [Saccharopolyspora mangrovi]|uniref:Alpha/beta fold hydrolase n=1 Tax=Saccharopolyspora mangrovi TaxID=3082379 RepID=A0ABU6AHQ4_9PSEU|nr:alpha/beta fold hydrolase [Saccharopolyspora sp. S2-29]MEB3370978.1 alpha/beta fold hydrolase [Saccharopolyspora sp. S2-29]
MPEDKPASTGFQALEAVEVTTPDHVRFVVRIKPQDDPSAPVVLVLPAMAMKAKFYYPLVKALHDEGLSVATADLRAQGESTPSLEDSRNFGYREIVETDLPAITEAVAKRFPEAPLHVFGHSLGGQTALLHACADPTRIAGLCLFATGSVYWRAFPPERRLSVLAGGRYIGSVSKLRGRWPGGLFVPTPVAGRVMTDWCYQNLTGRYRLSGSERNYAPLLRELTMPVMAISLDDDELGPKSNVDYLCTRIPRAKLTRRHWDAESGVVENLDHFGWIKDSPAVAAEVREWIADAA